MTEKTMKDLLFSLAWLDCSAYHNNRVDEILEKEFPNSDFREDLKTFREHRVMPPGKGCPR